MLEIIEGIEKLKLEGSEMTLSGADPEEAQSHGIWTGRQMCFSQRWAEKGSALLTRISSVTDLLPQDKLTHTFMWN